MKIQLGKFQIFLSLLFLLHFFFFFNIYYLLFNGKITNGEIAKYEIVRYKRRNGTVSELESYINAVIKFRNKNQIYSFKGKTNLEYSNSNVKVIFDPEDPTNAYEYSFFGFYFYRLLILVLVCLTISIPLFIIKLKKHNYLILDFEKRKAYIGKNIWTKKEEETLEEIINKTKEISLTSPYKFYYLMHKMSATGTELTNYILQELCLNETIKISARYVKLNPHDTKEHIRPFFSLGNKFSEQNKYTSIQNEILKLFNNDQPLRLHQLQQKLKSKFGLELDKVKENYINSELKKEKLLTYSNQVSESIQPTIDTLKTTLKFIEKNINSLIDTHPEKLSLVLNNLGSSIILLNKETITELKEFFKELKHKVPTIIFENLSSYFQDNTLFTPVALLSNYSSFETSFSSSDFSFDGGDFGGGGAGGDW